MLIYLFLEHFPNPYKPYIDNQLVYLINAGHQVKIFAGGQYATSLNKEVLKYHLDDLTDYHPNTLRDLPNVSVKATISLLKNPIFRVSKLWEIFRQKKGFKEKLMNSFIMLLMPDQQPDLCLLHNLTVVTKYNFLKVFYRNSRVVLYYHGGEVPRQSKLSRPEDLFSEVDYVFTCTEYSKGNAISRGCDSKKIAVTPVGFNIDKYPVTDNKQYKRNGTLRLISIGRLSDEKGFIFALNAIKDLVDKGIKNICYTIIGSGHLRKEFDDYVKQNKIEDFVIFAGEMENAKVIENLQQSDVLLLPSIVTAHCEENQACVVQEALLMQLVVITSKIGGVQESIPLGLEKFSVPESSVEALVEKISMANDLTQEEFSRFGAIGRDFVIKKYAVEHVTETLLRQSVKIVN